LYILSGKTTVLIFAETGIGKREEGEVPLAPRQAALHHHRAEARRKSNCDCMQENKEEQRKIEKETQSFFFIWK
jgi:hypothetical protein